MNANKKTKSVTVKKNIVIGVTGGIGTGKSRVLRFLGKTFDARILSADEIGHELMETGRPLFSAYVAEFGPAILNADGSLNKRELSSRAFSDKSFLKRMNAIAHPIIKAEIVKRISHSKKPAVFLEAALLSEGDLDSLCDFIVNIRSAKEIRMKRLISERGYSEEKCLSVIRNQKSDMTYIKESDATIDNNGDFSETEKALRVLMKKWKIPERIHRTKYDSDKG